MIRTRGWLAGIALLAAAIGLLVSCGDDNPERPPTCQKSGTIVLASSNYFTLEMAISDEFVYALQGADDDDGVPRLSLARFRDDRAEAERHLPDQGVIPFVRAAGDGAWFVVQGLTRLPDGSVEGFWSEVWEWPDEASRPNKRLATDWRISAIQPWDDDLIVLRSDESTSSLIRLRTDGTWESFHEFPAPAWAAMTIAGDQLVVMPRLFDNEVEDRVYWLGSDGQVLRESDPVRRLEFIPDRLEAVGSYLYAYRRGPEHPDLGGRPMYGAVVEIGPDGATRELRSWSNRFGQIAANSTRLFVTLEGEDPLGSDGGVYVQEERGQELVPFRQGIRGAYTVEASDGQLVHSRSRSEEPVYQLELTYLPSDNQVAACK